jgi:hypothetical protein
MKPEKEHSRGRLTINFITQSRSQRVVQFENGTELQKRKQGTENLKVNVKFEKRLVALLEKT